MGVTAEARAHVSWGPSGQAWAAGGWVTPSVGTGAGLGGGVQGQGTRIPGGHPAHGHPPRPLGRVRAETLPGPRCTAPGCAQFWEGQGARVGAP